MDNLNADNFRRWIKSHSGDEEQSDMTGMEVQAKYPAKKMIKNMCIEGKNPGRVIREFLESGGAVKSVSGNEYLITVASGEFTINKRFVVT